MKKTTKKFGSAITFVKKHWFTIAVVTLFVVLTAVTASTGGLEFISTETLYIVSTLIISAIVFVDFAYSRFNLPPFWHWKTYRLSK